MNRIYCICVLRCTSMLARKARDRLRELLMSASQLGKAMDFRQDKIIRTTCDVTVV